MHCLELSIQRPWVSELVLSKPQSQVMLKAENALAMHDEIGDRESNHFLWCNIGSRSSRSGVLLPSSEVLD